jgi:internalin A
LQNLYLSLNQITAVPDSLGQLMNLQRLSLTNNQITALPDSLGQLTNLQSLYLSLNQITALPDSLAQLANLQNLVLSLNQITALPDSLGRLTNLQNLVLSNNRIIAVPDSLGQLTNLQNLDLDGNQITALPDSLGQLTNLQGLYLHNNPGLGIPSEILGPVWRDVSRGKQPKPPQEILNYIRKADNARPLNEAKLILVGPGAVGKTSLVKTLITGKFNKKEKTTEGIKIDDWQRKLSKKDTVTVHIWDFGGQELMHATHQFFLTQRSLYLLVLNRRLGNHDREADYWLRLIRTFGGPGAPVIVVLNKQKSEPFDVNRGAWLEKYAGNIKAFVETDCETRKSVKLLERTIQKELSAISSLKEKFPQRWFAIKNELSRMQIEYLTFEKYREICRRHGEESEESQKQLAGFLHDLGIALNYRDDPRLRFNYVLKPEWVTHGIYSLLHAFAKNLGLFTLKEAEAVLKPKGYTSDATEFLIGLMERFELSFPLEDSQKRMLIPELLADQQPDAASAFDPAKCLNFGYQYTVLPEGLLPRFIVRTHHLSKKETRWKSGVVLENEDGQTRALITARPAENQVRIHIQGPEAFQREMLGMIRYNFDVIHRGYESLPTPLAYAPEAPERALPVPELEAMKKSSTPTFPLVLPDKTTVVQANVNQIIASITSGAIPLKLFLSYSHKDEKHIDELRKWLKIMERQALIQPWYDRGISPGEKWKEEILHELQEADVIVCQISPDFLNSDFCVLAELDLAIRRKEKGEIALVGYILHTCAFGDIPKLKSFQLAPRDCKPLRGWPDKHKYWQAVYESIKEAIKKLQIERQRQHPEKERAEIRRLYRENYDSA